jgi:hypothetical protein
MGRPTASQEVRTLIHTMSAANPLWGAPRIHGELLKLGFTISQTTVAKYMVRRQGPPSQTCRAFLANHAQQLVAADFFVIPTATFRLLLGWTLRDRSGLTWTLSGTLTPGQSRTFVRNGQAMSLNNAICQALSLLAKSAGSGLLREVVDDATESNDAVIDRGMGREIGAQTERVRRLTELAEALKGADCPGCVEAGAAHEQETQFVRLELLVL